MHSVSGRRLRAKPVDGCQPLFDVFFVKPEPGFKTLNQREKEEGD